MDELIARIEAGEHSNTLDVLIEVATFQPDGFHKAARANDAGTKVIYTLASGHDSTHWAWDWSLHPRQALAALRARQS